jgi:AmmeMemoRadiSam system protein B
LLGEWENEWRAEAGDTGRRGLSAVVPHAGWAFSGKLAYKTIRYLAEDCDTVIVVGGHMHRGEGVLVAQEEGFETPFGPLMSDREFVERLSDRVRKENSIPIGADKVPDNTVEVNLPFVKHLFPERSAVWLRVGAGTEAEELGRLCAETAEELEKKVVLIGSTDLTHYGPSYGFTPKGTGEQAFRWVRDENDGAIVRAMLNMETGNVLQLGNEHKAACSSGAAAAAISFAEHRGVEEGRLVGYASSHDVHPGDSFVGYAGIVYEPEES